MTLHTKIIDTTILMVSAAVLIGICVVPYFMNVQAAEKLRATTIQELTTKGVDPIAARCAIAVSTDYICIVYVSTRKEAPAGPILAVQGKPAK